MDVTLNTSTGAGGCTAGACISIEGTASKATASLKANIQDLLIQLDQEAVAFGLVGEGFRQSIAVALQSKVAVPLLVKAQVQSASAPNLFTVSPESLILGPYQQVCGVCQYALQCV